MTAYIVHVFTNSIANYYNDEPLCPINTYFVCSTKQQVVDFVIEILSDVVSVNNLCIVDGDSTQELKIKVMLTDGSNPTFRRDCFEFRAEGDDDYDYAEDGTTYRPLINRAEVVTPNTIIYHTDDPDYRYRAIISLGDLPDIDCIAHDQVIVYNRMELRAGINMF